MKNITKNLAALLVAVLLSCTLIACGNDNQDVNSGSSNSVPTSSETDNSASDNDADAVAVDVDTETSYPITVTDTDGDEITFDAEPMTIVSVSPAITEMIYELGAEDKLIARSNYCDYPEAVLELESVGDIYGVDVEKIISLNPDLVVVSTHFDAEVSEQLSELGINVLTLYEEHDMEGVYTMIETLGLAINKNAEAAEIIADMKATIADVEETVAGQEQPTVYYVVGYGEWGDYTATGDTFIAGMIEKAGGDNVAKDGTGWFITLEEIVEADPEIIIISPYSYDDFIAADTYKDLTAVKEGNVYTIDTNMLDRQGVRNDDAILEMAKIFYPDLF